MMEARSLGSAPRTSHLGNLDGVRAMACLLVVFSHTFLAGEHSYAIGAGGVAIFFALSGFLMAYLYARTPFTLESSARYAIARFARIAPVYWLVVIGCAVVTVFDPAFVLPIRDGISLLRHMLFGGSIGVFWSISPEVQYYAFFLAAWWGIAAWRRFPAASMLILLFCTMLLLTYRSWPGLSLPSKLHLFLAGSIAGLAPRPAWQGLHNRVGLQALQVVAVVMLVLAVARSSPGTGFYSFFEFGPVFAVALYLLSFESKISSMVLSSAPMRAIGRASFSIYLLHQVVFYYGLKMSRAEIGHLSGALLLLAGASIVIPMAFSRLVEMPLQKATSSVLKGLLSRAGWADRLEARPGPLPRT